MQITITEGLCKLKTLNNRIQKETNSAIFITTSVGGKLDPQFKSADDFSVKAKAAVQSLKDLIEQRNKIKAAIVSSNATTDVVIAGKTYKVAEAIERKSSVQFEKALLSTMIQQFNLAQRKVEQTNRQAQERLDKLLEQTFGKDAKVDPDNIKTMSDGFMSKNEAKFVDPLNIMEHIENLNNDIEEFLSNVDVALSVSNSTTFIEI
jgi:hypothetical protein